MQLISPRWNALAIEHLSDRSNLPLIESVRVETVQLGGGHDCSSIRIRFSNKYLEYFGVAHCPTKSWEGAMCERFKCDNINNVWTWKVMKILPQLFNRCSRIGRYELDFDTSDEHK
ncbi:hypothetical protein PENTCL1PPCAC_7841, partial [Pristionchus entomophagus]